MEVKFELIDGDIYVAVYQSIWDDEGGAEFLVHREKVTDAVTNMANSYFTYQINKMNFKK